MKPKTNFILLFFGLLAITGITSCKGKSDKDLQASVAAKLPAGVSSTVDKGVVTLTGMCKDEACKTSAEQAAKDVKGVKSVQNNITIEMVTAPPVEISPDENLRTSVASIVGSYKGVMADVKDGVVTLTGEIKRSDLQPLIMKLNEIKPKKVENKLVIK